MKHYNSEKIRLINEAGQKFVDLQNERLFTKKDMDELETRWAYRVAAAIAITVVVTTFLIIICKS